ncbi:MAG: DNRLRE domain-containing protein [Paludibacteraceae bacterium]
MRDGSYATTNYGTDALVVKQDNADGYRREAYLKFDLNTLNPDTIEKVELNLTVTSANTNIVATIWELYYVTDDSWNENTLTWNVKPSSSTLLGSFPGSPIGTKATYTLTQSVFNELTTGNKLLSVRVISTQRADGKTDATFASKETGNSETSPYLLITKKVQTGVVNYTLYATKIALLGNPVKHGRSAVVYFDAPKATDVVLKLSDLSGRIVYNDKYHATAGYNQLKLDTEKLSSGLYVVSVAGINLSGILKLVIN